MSHALELNQCIVPFNECPRAMGSMEIWHRYTRAQRAYFDNKNNETGKSFQKAMDDYAKYCGVEPRSMPCIRIECWNK